MGWYSQGTQVVDYVENADGTIDFKNAGFFIPANANTWVSHVFKVEEEADGRFTYYGATGDFAVGAGRNAIDIYKVTLPAPQTAKSPFGEAPDFPDAPPREPNPGPNPDPTATPGGSGGPGASSTTTPKESAAPTACVARSGLVSASAKGRGRNRGVAFDLARRADNPVTVDIFQQSVGRRITGERRVRRFENRTGAFTWDGREARGRRVPNGYYFARFRVQGADGRTDTLRLTLGQSNRRFGPRRAFFGRDGCGTLGAFKLSRPVFGGTKNRSLGIAYRLNESARVSVTVTNRRERTVKRFAARDVAAARIQRLTLSTRGLASGDYRVKLSVTRDGKTTTTTLNSRRL